MADEQEHAYNEPGLTSKEFLYAVMRDPTLPLGQRMDAAVKLLPLEHPQIPTYYGEFPASRTVEVIIRIPPLSKEPEAGFGPREMETVQ